MKRRDHLKDVGVDGRIRAGGLGFDSTFSAASAERGTGHSSSSVAEVNNVWSFTSTPLHIFIAVCLGTRTALNIPVVDKAVTLGFWILVC
jgi:hypothetical protein